MSHSDPIDELVVAYRRKLMTKLPTLLGAADELDSILRKHASDLKWAGTRGIEVKDANHANKIARQAIITKLRERDERVAREERNRAVRLCQNAPDLDTAIRCIKPNSDQAKQQIKSHYRSVEEIEAALPKKVKDKCANFCTCYGKTIQKRHGYNQALDDVRKALGLEGSDAV